MKIYSLHELNSSIRRAFEQNFSGRFWVTAETSGIKPSLKGGHFYFELLEKGEEHGQVIARSRAVIWRDTVAPILSRFEIATGQRFSNGIQVQLLVGVRFHENFGLSLDVYDIDPSFTLGDMARRRKETINRLLRENLLDLQKKQILGRPLRHIAVVSSASAAGWGDFQNHLLAEQSHWPFLLQLYPALMQGERVTTSISSALCQIEQSGIPYDCVVIIRGGGAEIDLMAFDSYQLCATIARFPIPVIVGIGHERDISVVDMVAHCSLKTPTAVADFLLHSRENEWAALKLLSERLQRAVVSMKDYHLHQIQRYIRDLPIVVKDFTQRESIRLFQLQAQLQRSCMMQIIQENRFLEHCSYVLESIPKKNLTSCLEDLLRCERRLRRSLPIQMEKNREKLEGLSRIVQLLSPNQTLKRGYAIVRKNGMSITSTHQIEEGEQLEILLHQGFAGVRVQTLSPEKENPET